LHLQVKMIFKATEKFPEELLEEEEEIWCCEEWFGEQGAIWHFNNVHKKDYEECPSCPKKFGDFKTLERHYEAVHKPELEAEEAGMDLDEVKPNLRTGDLLTTKDIKIKTEGDKLNGIHKPPSIQVTKEKVKIKKEKPIKIEKVTKLHRSINPVKPKTDPNALLAGLNIPTNLKVTMAAGIGSQPNLNTKSILKPVAQNVNNSMPISNTPLQLVKKEAEPTVFKCKECKIIFAHREKLADHNRSVHSIGGLAQPVKKKTDFKCEKCKFVSDTKQILVKHMVVSHGQEKFPCKDCTKVYIRKEGLATHRRIVHKG